MEVEEDSEELVDLRAMLELQLSEVEMLTSMFPNPGEFQLDDDTVLSDMQNFVDGKIKYKYLQCRIGFVVKIDVDGSKVFLTSLISWSSLAYNDQISYTRAITNLSVNQCSCVETWPCLLLVPQIAKSL